ncbi:YccF domain-containing protein [Pseudonocardia sp. ICBG1293]|uniref:YccF domain-containing protein n=1 Tax=Pseudonocardia sp. ICBG1293 TaxID=2844382 RepID=UPI001CCF8C60|nr:YccF domain-containing protein [Pseudonocardia sp. ICBG1293]
MLRLVLNVIWLVLSGFWLFLAYLAAGVVACVLVVTIPFGIASFRIGLYALWPFGRDVVRDPRAGAASTIGNVLWILLFGWWLVLGHVVTALALAVTIIGLPLAWANLKLIPVSLLPLGSRIVDSDAYLPGQPVLR